MVFQWLDELGMENPIVAVMPVDSQRDKKGSIARDF
jgi:hypothetical protein